MNNQQFLGLDIGHKRIGLAWGDAALRMAWPLKTIEVGEHVAAEINQVVQDKRAQALVVGRPRNQAGHATQQTQAVEQFVADTLKPMGLPIHWQDESVTSVIAEQRLERSGKPYTKAAVDAEAAAIILQDYLDRL